ncbi:hypothetical protein KAFR_0L01160 [Kazachstania africana CBS 2517]|uniref:Impact N-terminal domain-containing protein n=1 Tax=Kazachstania africana (strain ATCC 22294 / BCRC 22015 / CBS 2517 / CECT 1963 / NBRC 1671 / NRRL Y-8276) TaxID=1071382 RepID=H2B274_KAZAF|nr:hypothetical protein KAFR_0L01160 [Kazachstania africana CBS 2517]CCF60724.1 hypothetical protein KAFR_0L01160 [Kazachstania africana CBS 2517]
MSSWNESEILVDRKSKFQGRCCKISSQEDIPKMLQKLVSENKSVAKASHMHMYAWRVGQLAESMEKSGSKGKKKNAKSREGKEESSTVVVKNLQQGCMDGGEAGAGSRLLNLLERANIVNVLVIVTRWYGGTPLGSARFRHISTVAVQSLKKAKILA